MPPINPTGPGLSDVSQSKFFTPGLIGSVVQAPAATIVDEESGWWGSVQQFGAGIAIAVVLAATSASTSYAYQPDELPRITVEEADWIRPAPAFLGVSYPQPWSFDSGEQAIAPAEDEAWQGRITSTLVPFQSQNSTFDADELPQQAATTIVDEDTWQQTIPYPLLTFPSIIFDSDELPQQAAATIVEDEYWLNPSQSVLIYSQAASFDSGELAIAPYEDERWQSTNPTFLVFQHRSYTFDADELPPPFSGTVPDEGDWSLPLPSTTTYIVAATWMVSFADDAWTSMVTPSVSGIHYIPVFRRRRR